jgi:hypothetical protein
MLNATNKSMQSAGGLSKRSLHSKKSYAQLKTKEVEGIEMHEMPFDDN